MTTTVGAMERTIQLIHEQLPGTAVMVGGAVITQEFADQIGADFYAKDAAASTRVASAFFDELIRVDAPTDRRSRYHKAVPNSTLTEAKEP